MTSSECSKRCVSSGTTCCVESLVPFEWAWRFQTSIVQPSCSSAYIFSFLVVRKSTAIVCLIDIPLVCFRAVYLAVGLVYFLRLPDHLRAALDDWLPKLQFETRLSVLVAKETQAYIQNVRLDDGVAKNKALLVRRLPYFTLKTCAVVSTCAAVIFVSNFRKTCLPSWCVRNFGCR